MFSLPQQALDIKSDVEDFFNKQILPNNHLWHEQSQQGQAIPAIENTIKAKAKATAAAQVRKFKNDVKATSHRIMHEEGDVDLFKPSKPKIDGLEGVGIQGKHAAVNFNVATSDEGREAIACALVRLLRTTNETKVQDFIEGHQQIIIKPIKMTGKVGNPQIIN